MSHDRRVSILKTASLILIGFGLLMALSAFTPVGAVMGILLDLAVLPVDGGQSIAGQETRLLLAIAGGLLAGWGAMLWLIASHVYAPNPALGGRLILSGIAVWFVVDSAGSVLVGAWFNMVLNAGFLALFAGPILWPGRQRALAGNS